MYSIETRKFVQDTGRYTQWHAEFDNLKTFEHAVRAAEAHFVLVGSYRKLDEDIAYVCETACANWLDLPEHQRHESLSVNFYHRFGFRIVKQ